MPRRGIPTEYPAPPLDSVGPVEPKENPCPCKREILSSSVSSLITMSARASGDKEVSDQGECLGCGIPGNCATDIGAVTKTTAKARTPAWRLRLERFFTLRFLSSPSPVARTGWSVVLLHPNGSRIGQLHLTGNEMY